MNGPLTANLAKYACHRAVFYPNSQRQLINIACKKMGTSLKSLVDHHLTSLGLSYSAWKKFRREDLLIPLKAVVALWYFRFWFWRNFTWYSRVARTKLGQHKGRQTRHFSHYRKVWRTRTPEEEDHGSGKSQRQRVGETNKRAITWCRIGWVYRNPSWRWHHV